MLEVSFGIDVEPDCPPYLATQYRGVVDGLPKILDALDKLGVATTCFCTGDVASRFPDRVRELIERGHELGSHGHAHRPFDTLSEIEARADLAASTSVLRSFRLPITSFRAPNLRFPDRYLPLLEEQGFVVDSSQAKYNRAYYTSTPHPPLVPTPPSSAPRPPQIRAPIREPS